MKTFFLSILAICSIFTTSLAEVKEKTFDVKDFKKIELNGSSTVVYVQGETCSVKVKANEDIIDLANAYSDGETLCISTRGSNSSIHFGFWDFLRGVRDGFKSQDGTIVFFVTSPDITGINVLGSGEFQSKKNIDTDNLEVNLRGSGDVTLQNVICDQFIANLTGSGDIDVKNLESIGSSLYLRGSGDIDIIQQKVLNTDATVLGSGNITVQCTDCNIFNAKVTGSGDITIHGKVKKLNKSITGSGDINY